MESTAYFTRYDALLCKDCALDTSGLLNDGIHRLRGLTAIPVSELLADWPEASCEECKHEFAAERIAA